MATEDSQDDRGIKGRLKNGANRICELAQTIYFAVMKRHPFRRKRPIHKKATPLISEGRFF